MACPGVSSAPLPYAGLVAIETGYHPRDPVQFVVWDGSEEALADAETLTGQQLRADGDVLHVRLSGGVQLVERGWAVYREPGLVGVMAAGRVAKLRASTEP